MEIVGRILLFLFISSLGVVIQSVTRWLPWVNLLLSLLIVIIVPPVWSLGLLAGIWVTCAFFTFNPETDRISWEISLSLGKIFLSSLWTFSGFILTLLLLWKLKKVTGALPYERELVAWPFLILIEVCQYRVVSQLCPALYRIPLGYGIAAFNFLMILYWVFPMGITTTLLVLVSLLIISPVLLSFVDLPLDSGADPFLRRNR